MKQLLFTGFLLLSLFSCGNSSSSRANQAGSPQHTYHDILYKHCSDNKGWVRVTTKNPVLTAHWAPYQAKRGETVTIQGNVTDGGACFKGSGFSFQCEGIVAIEGNRTFTCNHGSGTISASDPYALSNQTTFYNQNHHHYQNHQTQNYYNISLISGQVHTYNNGQTYAVEIKFQNPLLPSGFAAAGGACSAGWTCQ